MKYRRFDHTADIGVRIFGETLKSLFEHGAEALFSLISGGGSAEKSEIVTLAIAGDTLEDLFMNWMKRLLFEFNGNERLIIRAVILSLSENALEAELWVVPFDPRIHEIQNEIKAVTYHGLIVEKRGEGWFAQVVFDV